MIRLVFKTGYKKVMTIFVNDVLFLKCLTVFRHCFSLFVAGFVCLLVGCCLCFSLPP